MALTDGLIAKYDLDTNANDSVGSNNGTLVGSPTFATDGGRTIMEVNGSSQYAGVTTDDFKFTESFSVSTWVKPDSLGSGWGRVLDYSYFGSPTPRSGWGIMWYGTSPVYEFRLQGPADTDGLVVSNTIEMGKWALITCTYDKTAAVSSIYVDGVLHDSATVNNAVDVSYTNVSTFGIGARLNPSPREFFDGSIDDTRIWNRALSASEVTELHAESLALGLIAKYDLDTNANDSVGSNNGTLVGSPTFAADGDRNIMTLDGVSDSVDCGRGNDLTAGFTMSTWIKTSETGREIILGEHHGGSSNGAFVGIGHSSAGAGKLDYYLKSTRITSSVAVNDNEWHLILATWTPGSEMKLYIDGQQVASGSAPASFGRHASSTFQLGSLSNASLSLSASMDDTRIWNRALSASEVATLHSTTAQISDSLKLHVEALGADTGYTLHGDAALTTVDGRSAITFDGNDYIKTSASNDFDFGTGDFSILTWVKFDNSSGHRYIAAVNTSYGLQLTTQHPSGGVLRMFLGSGSGTYFDSSGSTALSNDTWHHIAMVREGASTKCYLNGNVEISATLPSAASRVGSAGTKEFWMGQNPWDQNWGLAGDIDDARVYKGRALTTSEIASIMIDYDGYVAPDTTAPVITVLGTNPASVNAGATYTDAGATALDNIDGAVAVVTTGAVTTADVVTGLTKRIKFDGNDTEVTLAGNASLVTVDGRTAGSFPADGDYLDLPDVAATGNAPRSIAFWVKYLGSAQKITDYVNFVNTGTGTNSQSFNVVSYGGTHGVPGIMGYNNDFYPTTGTAINDDTWHHVAATFDGTTLKMYVDGTLDNSTTKAYNTQGQDNKVAQANHSGGAQTLRGKMDDLRFYDRALTAAEVTTIYDSAGADILGAVAGTYTLTYTATDAASNVATATRTVNVIADTTAPVITVLGSSPVTVAVGAVYTDAGATALDNIDGAVAVVTTGLEALSSTNVTSGLTKHLKFDGSDTEITLAGNASMVTVDGRTAGSFPADGDYIDLPDLAITGNAPRSIAFWVKYLGSAQKNTSYVYFTGTGTGANSQMFCVVSYGGTHGIPGVAGWNNDFYPTNGTSINDDTWHHVAVTHDGTTLKIYVDGSLDNSTTKTYNTQGQNNTVAQSNHGPQTLRGKMDDLRFYDRALTAAEVTTIYDSAGADTFGAQLKQLDANFSDVTLLLPLDSDLADASTSGHTVTAVGNAAISTSEKKFGAGSAYFDGSGDYMAIPNSDDFDFGAGDFTIEMWTNIDDFNATYVGNSYRPLLHVGSNAWTGSSGDFYAIVPIQYAGDTPKLRVVYVESDGTVRFNDHSAAGVLQAGTWHHIAMVRDGNTIRAYVDGTMTNEITGVNYDVSVADTTGVKIGAWEGTHFMKGYIDDVRITKGLARYTANFAVPTAAHPLATTMQNPSAYTVTYTATDAASNVATATRTVNVEADTTAPVITVVGDNPAAVTTGATYTDAGATAVDNIDGAVAVVTTGADTINETADANWNDVALLLNDDDADASSASQVITGANNLPTVVVDPETGVGNVLYFDGNACMRIEGSAGEVVLGTNDFTFETWFKTGNTGAHALFDFRESATGGTGSQNATMSLNYPSQSIVRVWSSSSPVFDWNGGAPITNNTWAHLALTRESNTLRLFINGTLINSTTTTRDFNASCDLFIGGDSNNNWRFVGYMKQLRLTRGVARYTSSFSAPTEAHPTAASGGAITGTHTVTYTATDAASNVATATRTVNVVADTTAPVITVVGDNPAAVTTGATYTDAGATAVDNIDGAVAVVTTGVSAISTTADANWNDVKLLLPFNSDLTDSSTSAHSGMTSLDASIVSSSNPYGTNSCVRFDYTKDGYISYPDSDDWNFGNGDFTIELWLKPNSNGYWSEILSQGWNSGNDSWAIGAYFSGGYSGELQFMYTTNGSTDIATGWTSPLAVGTWQHIAVVRNGTTIKTYVNGVEAASHNCGTNTIYSSSAPLYIGNRQNQLWNLGYDGDMADIRITKGAARYTANFSVPTAAHPTAATGGAIAGTHTVTYTATDAASNQAQATRTVNVITDVTSPVITVLGDNPVAVVPGATYTDAGATAVDNIDGAVSVVTTGVAAISTSADANWNDVILLLPLDSDITDSSVTPHTLAGGAEQTVAYYPNNNSGNEFGTTPVVSTSEKKFGNGSMFFDGTKHTDYLSVPDHEDLTFGAGDFTIELWMKPIGAINNLSPGSTWQEILSHGWNSQASGDPPGNDDSIILGMYYDQGGKLNFGYTTNGSTDKLTGYSSVAPTVNDWNHIAIVRATTTITMYLNGTSVASINCGTDVIHNSGKPFLIGNRQNQRLPFNGYIDDLRITKGVARYTANFSVPTAASPTAASGGAITGTHTVTYTAVDAASNVGIATRTVNVADPSNYSTLSDGVNKYNYIANSGVVGLAVPTALVGLKKSSADEAGIHIDLDEYLHGTAGVTVWIKDFSDNWTVWDATPQEHFELAWLDTIESVFFQLGSASSRDIRILKVQNAVRYDADKTDADDTPGSVKSTGEAPVAISGIYSEPVVQSAGQNWAQGEIKIFVTAASRSSLIQLWTYSGNVATLAKATEFEIDVSNASQASITKLSAGMQDVKVRIMD